MRTLRGNWPMKHKYIEEALGFPWFIFGESEGYVDISNADGDVIQNVPKDKALRIVRAAGEFHWKILNELGVKYDNSGTT